MRSSVKVGGTILASYTYTAQNNYLERLAYGNGDSVQYTYDDKGRVIQETYEDGDTVTYAYDSKGRLATVTDSATGITTTYYYDPTGNLARYVESGTGHSHWVNYTYDALNNLTQLVENINGSSRTTDYTYDDDNRITKVTAGTTSKSYTYDGFGRVILRTTRYGTTVISAESITYHTVAGKTNGHVAALENGAGAFTYTYDGKGNIKTVTFGGKTTTYTYDKLNQLTREDNQAGNFTYVWEYDDGGNILSRKKYSYTTGNLGAPTETVNYGYGNANWGDLLTSYKGSNISYDTIGNVLNDGTRTYTWEHGRELVALTKDSKTWSYTYDANGMRTKRAYGSTVYRYVYNGSQLSQMTIGNNTLLFTYDAGGMPMTVTYNGTVYYYATNLQGDVVAILNNAGVAVVEYTYDAWGNVLSIGGDLADTLGEDNPFRYRGYIYDTETGLYYLQSRYYNPEIGRFINADAFVSTGQGMLGNNMFAYCNNNPTKYVDHFGAMPMPSNFSYSYANGGGPYKVVDLTETLNDFMYANAQKLQLYLKKTNYASAAIYFYNNVKDGGELDIKLKDQWSFQERTIYYYKEKVLRYDDPGNINFGYVGAVLFPEEVLCFGAGVNQMSKYGFKFGNISSYYDDPRDQEMIRLGFAIYREAHS